MDTIGKQKRNIGIDLLRIVSMFMIVVIHCNGHGGVLDNTKVFSVNNSVAYLGQALVFVAVNIFAIISGYVNIENKKRKLPRIIELWFQAFFYSASMALIFRFLQPSSIDTKTFLKSFFPVTGVVYWYFSAFFCMMLFLPIINKLINTLTRKQHILMIVLGVIAFGIYGIFSTSFTSFDIFSVSQGFSFLWLAFVYSIGAYIKKYEKDFKSIKNIYWLLIYIGCSILTWLSKVVIDFAILKVFGIEKLSNTYYSSFFFVYISPLYVIAAVALLMLFKNLKIKHFEKPIKSVASVSFGVYLISEYPAFRHCFVNNKFVSFATLPWYQMVGAVLATAIIIYAFCTIIDYVRKYLFKLLHIRQLSNKISNLVYNLIDKIKIS